MREMEMAEPIIQYKEILMELGREKIDLSRKESLQKRFCNFIRDFGINAVAHVNYQYKTFRYFLDVENKELAKFLFDHVTFWAGKKDGENKLYFVAQPYRTYTMNTIHDLLDLLLRERKFLEFCKENGHKVTLDFDNNYNWRGDEAFLIIIELESEKNVFDSLDVKLVDWGVETIYSFKG